MSLIDRMIRAAKLDVELYEEVEADESLNGEALMAVVVVSLAGGVGSLIGGLGQGIGSALTGLVFGVIVALLGYFVWAAITTFVGTRLFGGTSDFGEVRRVLGYAYAPNALGVFSFIPMVGGILVMVGSIWALVAGVVAIRQAMDFDTTKAILTVVIGWIVLFILSALFAAVGLGAAMLGGAMGG
ncbi:MAG: YIP1 family protein [Chloroflexi bacterium]|nr:YIP1 family protein [Chloroflexota bacterium]